MGKALARIVVEEESSDAAAFVPVGEMEVGVTGCLALRVQALAEGRAGGLCDPVPVEGVFVEAVVGGEVEAAAEPPDGLYPRFAREEEAEVRVRGGGVGVAGMDDQRRGNRLVVAAGEFGPTLGRCRGQLVATRV